MPGPLVHAVAGGDQVLLVFVHEAGPALQHDDDVEIGGVLMPARAFFRCLDGPDELCDHPAARGIGDSKVTIFKKLLSPSVTHGVSPGFTWENTLTVGLSSIPEVPFVGLRHRPGAPTRGQLRNRPASRFVPPSRSWQSMFAATLTLQSSVACGDDEHNRFWQPAVPPEPPIDRATCSLL